MKSTANHQHCSIMKTLTYVISLLACGLLPLILSETIDEHSSEEDCTRDALKNMALLPLQKICDELDQIHEEIRTPTPSCQPKYVPGDLSPRDCADLYRAGYNESGVYNVNVYVAGYTAPVPVYCDMETDGGGWLVFQRRQDGSVDFHRNWTEYADGFGNVTGEFWLGNDLIHLFSDHEPQQLRVDLRDHEGDRAFAKYDHFYFGPQTSDYFLIVGNYSGDAGDSLTYHDHSKFSTKDRDNDEASEISCALHYHGGWWFSRCHHSNLNGLWEPTGEHNATAVGEYAHWYHWRGWTYSILFTEMKMRPQSF